MTLKHLSRAYYKNISHFLTFWGHFGAILGLNLMLSLTSHVTTQNDCKRSRIPMEMISEVNLKMLMSFQDIWDHGSILGLFLVISMIAYLAGKWVSQSLRSHFRSRQQKCGRGPQDLRWVQPRTKPGPNRHTRSTDLVHIIPSFSISGVFAQVRHKQLQHNAKQ